MSSCVNTTYPSNCMATLYAAATVTVRMRPTGLAPLKTEGGEEKNRWRWLFMRKAASSILHMFIRVKNECGL